MAIQKRIVIALGGNALQRQGEASADDQKKVAADTARQLVPLIKEGYQLVIVHGNGPQVGNIVLHEEAINTADVPTLPLDSCVAMSQGSIGFWLQQALNNAFTEQQLSQTVVTLVSQMVVRADDAAFQNPTKPIGPFYADETEAEAAANERGFVVKEDAGRGWRRVVPSPKPVRLVETATVEKLIHSGTVVITAGGGGVPVIETDRGLSGVEAVIDKDFSAAVVADAIDAEALIILTAVDTVSIRYREPDEEEIYEADTQTMQGYIDAGYFAPGSMLPKVQAAMKFVQKPGRRAVIASLEHALDAVKGTSGTTIRS